MLQHAVKAALTLSTKGISARVCNVTSPLHLDKTVLRQAADTKLVVAYEDHITNSGLGCMVAQEVMREKIKMNLLTMGINNYGASDNASALYQKQHLDPDALVRVIIDNL